MEYADDGDLYMKILEHQKKKTHFKEDKIWSLIVQLLNGLNSLH